MLHVEVLVTCLLSTHAFFFPYHDTDGRLLPGSRRKKDLFKKWSLSTGQGHKCRWLTKEANRGTGKWGIGYCKHRSNLLRTLVSRKREFRCFETKVPSVHWQTHRKDLVMLGASARQRVHRHIWYVGSHSHRPEATVFTRQQLLVWTAHCKLLHSENSSQCVNLLSIWHSCILAYWNRSNTKPWNEAKLCVLWVNNAHEVFIHSPLTFSHYLSASCIQLTRNMLCH